MSLTMPWKASSDAPNGVAEKLDDVRRTLSKEADRVADLAVDYTRNAGEHVADKASEHASNAGSVLNDLMKAGATLGTAIALGGRKTAQDLGDNAQSVAKDLGQSAQSVAKDLRKVRVTTEPRRTGPDFAPGITLLAGFGAGIALMYFLDPERGQERRNLLRDKLMAFGQRANTAMQDATSQMRGQMAEMRGQMASDIDTSADLSTDTQPWQPTEGNGGENSTANPDGSTTDTWGTQPQREPTSI
jgi:hypothetical protein